MVEREINFNDPMMDGVNPVQASADGNGNGADSKEISDDTKLRILKWKERMTYKTYKDLRIKRRN
jgi:hypothetical protein